MSSKIITVSVSPIWYKTMQEANISPSKALKDGIALNLALVSSSFFDSELGHALYTDSKLPAYKAMIAAKIQEIYKN